MISRQQIIDSIHIGLKDMQQVQAIWLGGSDAFFRNDEFSDIDIRVLTTLKDTPAVFAAIDNVLNKIDEIVEIHEPIISRYPNRYYKLKNASKYNIVDVVFAFDETLAELLDAKRMGEPIILVDKQDVIKPHATSMELMDGFKSRLEDLKNQFRIGARLVVERAIKRQRFSEAVFFYNTRVMAPLVELLRNKYCPERQDFLLRYLQWDLPEDIAYAIDALHRISSFADIEHNLEKAEKMFLDNC
ncbi:MAG: hypothetical protein ACK5WS_03810 [Alphaproteobacteria bacterium]